ncbi:MAG: hypothetical protein IJI37_06970 [Opitutales bacterium]|nr:hypothetical protein [Opitutales bacterium]
MKAIYRFLKLARKEPFGCLFSCAISAAMICAFAAGMVYIIYSMAAVSLVKGTIKSATGFNATAQSIYANVFTGYFEIDGLHITNPTVYDSGARSAAKDNTEKFLHAKKIKMVISPTDLLRGRFTVSSFEADITFLNCVRITNSVYNLPEFLGGMKEVSSIKISDRKPLLEKLDISIAKAAYVDLSAKSDSMVWSMSDFKFSRADVSDFEKAVAEMKGDLEKSNAPFVSSGLDILAKPKH